MKPPHAAASRGSVRALRVTLALGVIASALMTIGLCWLAYTVYAWSGQASRDALHANNLRDKIIYLEEVMTMSARMAAVTGDPVWEKRYHEHAPQLAEAINELRNFAPENFDHSLGEVTAKANERRVKMESLAFQKIAAGDKQAAWQILNSAEFDRDKKIYAHGLNLAMATIQPHIDEKLRRAHMASTNGALSSIALSAFVAIGWISAYRILHQLRDVQRELQDRLAIKEATLNSIGDAVVCTDAMGCVTRLNRAAEQLTGWTIEEARGKAVSTILHIVHSTSRDAVENPIYQALATRSAVTLADNTVIISRNGEERPIADSCAPIFDRDNLLIGAVMVFRDVTAELEAKHALQERIKELRCQHVIRDALDADLPQAQWAAEILADIPGGMQHPHQTAINLRIGDNEYKTENWSPDLTNGLHADICVNDQVAGRLSVFYTDPQLSFLNAFEESLVSQIAWLIGDAEERRLDKKQLRELSCTDKLTGLPNRVRLHDHLQHAVERAKRNHHYHFALLFLDFDRFKSINDSLGHVAGDDLLKQIAKRLQVALRATDSAVTPTSARLGGDEFVVLLDGLAHPDDATTVAQRLMEVLSQPYRVGEHEVVSTPSIGIATSDITCASAEDVMRDADTAMYEAKHAGRGRYVVFDTSMRDRVQHRMMLEQDLRHAVARNQLRIAYQPIVSLQSGALHSLEALLRWQHPTHGFISPAEFIPIAEEAGIIFSIGEWVLREACRQFMDWQRTMTNPPPQISVNISRKQLMLPQFVEHLKVILAETGMKPECLHLEITESAVMQDVEAAVRILKAFKSLGIKLDLDDFGTGYSSLACLKQFPIDVLKVDGTFIANVDHGREYAALVQSVAQLARNLNIAIVAEGIETMSQALILQSLECDFGQGYLFSKPLWPDQVPHFLCPKLSLPGNAA